MECLVEPGEQADALESLWGGLIDKRIVVIAVRGKGKNRAVEGFKAESNLYSIIPRM